MKEIKAMKKNTLLMSVNVLNCMPFTFPVIISGRAF